MTSSSPRSVTPKRATGGLPPLAVAVAAALSLPCALGAQAVEDPARLAGLDRVDIATEAQWDELITNEAGAATEAQFVEALGMSFAAAMGEAEAGPTVLEGAPVTVRCHVDTFYDRGLIVYGLRVQTEVPGDDGEPVVTWLKSWVGSYTVQQLHLMFRLGEQCADGFLEDWGRVN
jgi:hypothetical protein